jgi:hypothetical protein
VQTFVRERGDNIVLNGSATTIFGLQLEDSLGNGFLREEGLVSTRPAQINLDLSDTDAHDQNASILLEDGSNDGATSVLLKEGDDTVETTGIEDNFGGAILLEMSTLDRINDTEFAGQTSETVGGFFVQDDGGKLLIDRFQEDSTVAKLLLDGTDSSGTNDGQQLATENAGDSLILNSTDGDDDANDKVLFEDETGSGDILLDGTDSSSTDAGDNIINEEAIDFSNKNVTITDSSGASATIMKANIGTITSSVAITQTNEGSYIDIQSLLGEDLNRIQDSYYYQDYSYEVQVGVSLGNYLKQLQKAVHPAGFAVFGKVKISSSVSAAITNAGSSLGGGYYSNLGVTAPEDKFSPRLASTFEVLFDETFQRRLGTNPQGNEVGAYEQRVILEDAEDVTFITDAILLNGTDSSSSDAGFFLREEETAFIRLDERIQIEEATDTTATSPESFIIQESGGDRIISETGIALSNNLALDGTGDSGHVVRQMLVGIFFLMEQTQMEQMVENL